MTPPLKFTPTNSLFGWQIQTLTRGKEKTKDKVLEQLDEKNYKLPDTPNFELGDGLANVLSAEAEYILRDSFINPKRLEEDALQNIYKKYGFEEIKDAFDEASVLQQLEFFYGGDNDNPVRACNFSSLNEDNNEFISVLCSKHGQNIVANNKLSIYIESENNFYQNFNTNENVYSFLLAQQDETKAIIPKRITYYYSFQKYVKNYLPYFSVDDVKKFDLYENRSSEHLLYKFNDLIESLERAEKLVIWHTVKAKDSVSLKTIEDRDRQFLIEKIIHGFEFTNPYVNSIEKKTEIINTVAKNCKISRRAYQSFFVDVADSFIEYIHSLDCW